MKIVKYAALFGLPLACAVQAQDAGETGGTESATAQTATASAGVSLDNDQGEEGALPSFDADADAEVEAEVGAAETVETADAVSAPSYRMFSDEEVSAIEMPALAFEANERIVGDFDKYYYFHRDDTSFSEAYADITECDQLSSGISYYAGGGEPYPGYYASQYGIGGAIGGAIGSAIADAIFGSAGRRKIRRINMRNCMGFKGYQRYGLEKDLWKEFHFEEGNGRKRDDVREAALLQQARVASGPKPEAEELGI